MNGNMNLGKRVTALEKDGGADIKKEISDLQVAVATVQGAVTIAQKDIDALETKVNIGHVYSTEEKAVGTWIDGTTVYERTYTLNAPIAQEVALEENVKHLITQTGHWVQTSIESQEQLFPREYDPNTSTLLIVKNNSLVLITRGLQISRCSIIARYTKTV